eukprot:comp18532_c0_seq1/m.19960 comp18532_c0_seq1/g.19960  ORF comp18532_c0_seq1/g.19960 comp18532_c0_seq1/m.19960 type:complete len:518 (-) comp18532_c0_seq1:214-1767(-)
MSALDERERRVRPDHHHTTSMDMDRDLHYSSSHAYPSAHHTPSTHDPHTQPQYDSERVYHLPDEKKTGNMHVRDTDYALDVSMHERGGAIVESRNMRYGLDGDHHRQQNYALHHGAQRQNAHYDVWQQPHVQAADEFNNMSSSSLSSALSPSEPSPYDGPTFMFPRDQRRSSAYSVDSYESENVADGNSCTPWNDEAMEDTERMGSGYAFSHSGRGERERGAPSRGGAARRYSDSSVAALQSFAVYMATSCTLDESQQGDGNGGTSGGLFEQERDGMGSLDQKGGFIMHDGLSSVGGANGKLRRSRTLLTTMQIEALEREYVVQDTPTTEKINLIASMLKLEARVVRVWFQNRRARRRKSLRSVQSTGSVSTAPALSQGGNSTPSAPPRTFLGVNSPPARPEFDQSVHVETPPPPAQSGNSNEGSRGAQTHWGSGKMLRKSATTSLVTVSVSEPLYESENTGGARGEKRNKLRKTLTAPSPATHVGDSIPSKDGNLENVQGPPQAAAPSPAIWRPFG